MNTSPRLQSRRRLVPASLVLAALAAIQSAHGATQYWDPGFTPSASSGKGSGGAGTWATATANWSDGSSDAVLTATNVAGFAGASGTVGLTTAVTTAGLVFETNNYTIGNGNTGGQISITSQVTDSQGIVVGSGVTGTVIDVGSIKLGSSGSGVSIWLQNTDLVDFKNTAIYLSGSRTTKISNSTTSGTTTFAKFGASDKPTGGTWPNTSLSLNQGNLTINSLAAASNANGTLATYMSATAVNTTINGSSSGTVTINGNNTLFQNVGVGGSLTLTFNMASGTLALGHDNALGAKNASDQATSTGLILTAGTVAASGGSRNIANAVTLNGNASIGGGDSLTLSGNFTQSAGNRTLTVNNTAATTLSASVFLANDDVTARTLTLAGTGNTTISGAIANNAAGNTVASGFTITNTGVTTFSGANTYTGVTTVSAGTLAYGANNVFADAAALVLNGGALAAGSFTDTLGTLDLNAASAIMFGSGGALAFANSSATDWGSFGLSVSGSFVSGSSLRFGTSNAGLTSGQLGLISIAGYENIALDANGYVTASAIPEPSAFSALAGLVVLGAVALRRRR